MQLHTIRVDVGLRILKRIFNCYKPVQIPVLWHSAHIRTLAAGETNATFDLEQAKHAFTEVIAMQSAVANNVT